MRKEDVGRSPLVYKKKEEQPICKDMWREGEMGNLNFGKRVQ